MKALFAQLTLAVVGRDVARNIVSFREPQNVFDDLSERADEWKVADQVQDEVGLPLYRSKTPIIDRSTLFIGRIKIVNKRIISKADFLTELSVFGMGQKPSRPLSMNQPFTGTLVCLMMQDLSAKWSCLSAKFIQSPAQPACSIVAKQ